MQSILILKKHVCNICNKEYSTRQNLWKHNKNNHTIESNPDVLKVIHNSNPKVILSSSKNVQKQFSCIKCNAIFKYKQGKWKHEKKCNINNQSETELLKKQNELLQQQLKEKDLKIKEETELFKKEIDLMKKQMLEIMNKQNKIHPKTLTKINKQLNNNTLNDNKVINNNINIIQLGGESLDTLFNKNQQLDVLSKRYKCLEYLVKQVHFNDKYQYEIKNL